MANTIGYTGGVAFITSTNELQANACKFTAPASFTPNWFYVDFNESWGTTGTAYVAIYSDNAGVPGTVLWSGSASYPFLHSGLLEIAVSGGPALSSSTNYWLACYFQKDSGTFNINLNTASDTSAPINRWNESVAGSWTNDPTVASTVSNRKMRIYATDTKTFTKNNSVKAFIVAQVTKNNFSKAFINKTYSFENYVKGQVVYKQAQANTPKANIRATTTKDSTVKANILATGQQPNQVKANILRIDSTTSQQVKANILTTYYTGATYDWKLAYDEDNNQNRGWQE